MLDFLGREIGALINNRAELEDFVTRNLQKVTYHAPPSGLSFSQINDEYILDVNERPNFYPYFVLAHYDDEIKTMRLHYMLQTQFEQKSEAQLIHDRMYNATTMRPWIERIMEETQRGEPEISFNDIDDETNPDNTRALNNFQATWLRRNGFTVNWEKYLKTWVVKGHAL